MLFGCKEDCEGIDFIPHLVTALTVVKQFQKERQFGSSVRSEIMVARDVSPG